MPVRSVAILAVLVAGCGAEPGPAVETSEAVVGPGADRARVAEPAPPPDVRPGASLDRILAHQTDDGSFFAGLRPPLARRAEAVANRHVAGQTDSLVTLVYDGLEIEAYAVAGGETFLRWLTVTGTGYGTASGLSVGEARAHLEDTLGPPARAGGDVATYETGDGAAPTVVEVT